MAHGERCRFSVVPNNLLENSLHVNLHATFIVGTLDANTNATTRTPASTMAYPLASDRAAAWLPRLQRRSLTAGGEATKAKR